MLKIFANSLKKSIQCALLVCSLYTHQTLAADTDKQESMENIENTVVAKVGDINIRYAQVVKLLLPKLQGMQTPPTKEEVQKMYLQAREEMIDLAKNYKHNLGKLKNNTKFLRDLLFSAMLLAREFEINDLSKGATDADLKKVYKELVDKMPIPMEYKLKACVLNSEETASKVIKALEGGANFATITSKYSVSKEFVGGNVLDPVSKKQFVGLYSEVLPSAVKLALMKYNKPTSVSALIKEPIRVVDKDNKVSFWVVQLDMVRAGSKEELVKQYDPRLNPQLSTIFGSNKLSDKLKTSSVEVKRFTHDGKEEEKPKLS